MMNNFNDYKHKLFYSFFVLFTLCHFYLIGTQNIREILNTIPKNEKEDLDSVFHSLFNLGNFSYTLFGDKPMSLIDHSTTLFDYSSIPSAVGLRFWKRWEVWKKYEHLFPMTHYLLIEDPSDKNGSKDIYLINKKYFINKVDEHLDLFQKVFGASITGALLLKEIEEDHKFLSILDHYPLLLGILLGYGEHNARLFDKRDQISHFVYKKQFPKVPIKIASPSEGFASLQDEFNSYFSVLTLFGDPKYSPLLIRPVYFVADHKHPETIALIKKYKEQRHKICAIYAKGDFLEITLQQLTKETDQEEGQ